MNACGRGAALEETIPAAPDTRRSRRVAAGYGGVDVGSIWSRCQIEQFARAVFPTTYGELVAVTGGTPADVA